MRDGDEATLRALYPALRRLAAVAGAPAVEPDDLVQEAITRTLRGGPLSRLDDPGAYLRRTILNLAANEQRGARRLGRALPRLVSQERSHDEYPSELHDLFRLAPEVRASLYLAEVEGWSFAQIAELLGCSEQSARARASRGRRRLRIDLVGDGT